MQATKAMESALLIPRGELRFDPKLNPRFIFKDIEGLARSLKEQGQVEPLIVRRSKDGKGYDVGAGARRLKAAELGKLLELSCIVREMTDADMLAMSLAENGDREDLHPMEEAEAFRRFREEWKELGLPAAKPVDEIAASVGKSKGFVLGRLRLAVDLAPSVRQAFVSGVFGVAAAMAFLVAGSKERQEVVLKDLLTGRRHDAKIEADAVRDYVRTRCLLRLADARFPLGDATLPGGACGKCPKNSSNQPELFEGAKISGDALCTDAKCFDDRKTQHNLRRQVDHDADGYVETAGPEAKKAWTNAVSPAVWIPGDDRLPEDEKGRTLDALLGRDKVARGYALDPAGWLRSLVRRADAVGGLRRAGHAEIADKVEAAGKPKDKEPKPDEAAKSYADAVLERLRAVVVEKSPPNIPRAVLLAVVGHLVEQSWAETLVGVVRRRKLDDAGAKGNVRGRARAMVLACAAPMLPAGLWGLAVELVASHDVLVQAELKGAARKGRPLWELLDAYAVDVSLRAAKAKPSKAAKEKANKKFGKVAAPTKAPAKAKKPGPKKTGKR